MRPAGDAYLQKARETFDPSYYARADSALREALQRDPRDAGALTAMGSLANARHDFAAGLRFGQRAHAAAPGVVKPYGVIVDALVELGRYAAAERALQRMVDMKPNLDSYARVSYFRELHGDVPGAVEAMRLAAAAGGDARENLAYVQTLLGNLELARGRVGAARAAYGLALSRYPDYVPAQAGLARVSKSKGELLEAIRHYRRAIVTVSEPKVLVALGEAELVAGRDKAAARHFRAAKTSEADVLSSGGQIDADTALLEAEHGSTRRRP